MLASGLPSLAEVEREVPVPPDAVCVFLSGSLVVGWGNELSDLDVYVVAPRPPEVEATGFELLALDPPEVPKLHRQVAGRRWDVEYWRESQVRELLAKFGPAAGAVARIGSAEIDAAYKLAIGVALAGSDWLAERQRELAGSTFRRRVRDRLALKAERLVEDARGFLADGDDASAVLAAHAAFGRAVDTVLAARSDLAPGEKWRARKLRSSAPKELAWEEFWRVSTFADLAALGPVAWVGETLERVERLTATSS